MKTPHFTNKAGICTCDPTWEPPTICVSCNRGMTTHTERNNWRVYGYKDREASIQVHLCGDCADDYIIMNMLGK